MDRKTYDFTKKSARTAYEEAIRNAEGGDTIDNHRHLDYALVDHGHPETTEDLQTQIDKLTARVVKLETGSGLSNIIYTEEFQSTTSSAGPAEGHLFLSNATFYLNPKDAERWEAFVEQGWDLRGTDISGTTELVWEHIDFQRIEHTSDARWKVVFDHMTDDTQRTNNNKIRWRCEFAKSGELP